MQLPQTVEWALHCCWLLAQADGKAGVPRRRMAEFFELPEPYLAKLLNHLVVANVLQSVPGRGGGYRLARPAEQITALQIVRAVARDGDLFHCREIRQRGPVALTAAQCSQPCGIAKVMHRAESAWRAELASTTLAELTDNAPLVSQERAARFLGSSARPELTATGTPADNSSNHRP